MYLWFLLFPFRLRLRKFRVAVIDLIRALAFLSSYKVVKLMDACLLLTVYPAKKSCSTGSFENFHLNVPTVLELSKKILLFAWVWVVQSKFDALRSLFKKLLLYLHKFHTKVSISKQFSQGAFEHHCCMADATCDMHRLVILVEFWDVELGRQRLQLL
jgi:hypothetical protein